MGKIKQFLPYIMVKDKIDQRIITYETSQAPTPYNEDGETMQVWYMQDKTSEHTPYAIGAAYPSSYIWWDRFNYSLPVRFFGHDDIFKRPKQAPEGDKDFALLIESEPLASNAYQKLLTDRGIAKSYQTIFTCSERVLDQYPNAKFAPGNGYWYGSVFQGGKLDSMRYLKKTKNISMIASAKCMCEGHRRRLEIANRYKNSNLVDTYGNFGGIDLPKKAMALDDYRYSIAMENDVTSYYFTEKILDCFASMCVPIYVGATRIADFFNPDGIIQVRINQLSDIDKIIEKCTVEDYMQRKDAIIDNYNRVLKYRSVDDYLYREYGEAIGK